MATLPRQVQKQVEAAEALLAGKDPAQLTQTEVPATPEPAVQSEPTAQPAAQAPAPQANQDEPWERRYKTLQGLFNAEVPKLQTQVKDLSAKYQEAIERLESVAKQQETQARPEQQATANPKDVEDFGSDLVEMVQRQTQHVLGSVAQKLDGVVASFEKRLIQVEQALKGTSQTVAMTAEEMFFSKLAQVVPDWEQINSNDAWLAWLGDVDPVYGQPRQVALDAAQKSMDVNRVAAVFNAFKGTLPKTPKTNPLEKQVSPKAAASAPPVPTEKPVLTEQQIAAFYKDVALGKYRGRDAEVARTEQMINEAIADGRVR